MASVCSRQVVVGRRSCLLLHSTNAAPDHYLPAADAGWRRHCIPVHLHHHSAIKAGTPESTVTAEHAERQHVADETHHTQRADDACLFAYLRNHDAQHANYIRISRECKRLSSTSPGAFHWSTSLRQLASLLTSVMKMSPCYANCDHCVPLSVCLSVRVSQKPRHTAC